MHGFHLLAPLLEQSGEPWIERRPERDQAIVTRTDVACFNQPAHRVQHLLIEENSFAVVATKDVFELGTDIGRKGVRGESNRALASEETLREKVPQALRAPPAPVPPEARRRLAH